jgi:hypothetical protein
MLVAALAAFAAGAAVRAAEDDEDGEDAPAPSVSIAPVRGSTQLPHPPDRKWKLGERACTDDGRCGTVRMVTRDYAVVDIERAKAKSAPKKKKRRDEGAASEPEERELPPPKPLEPEPPSSFSNVPADQTDAPALLPEPIPSSPAVTVPARRKPRPSLSRAEALREARRRREASRWWRHFQLNVAGAFRSSAKQFAPQVSWSPTFAFEDSFRLRGHLGLTALRTEVFGTFLVAEPGFFASFGSGPFHIEPGVGMQIWSGNGVFPLLQMNFAVSFEGSGDAPKFLVYFFVAPAVVFSTTVPTYFVKAGFGLTL